MVCLVNELDLLGEIEDAWFDVAAGVGHKVNDCILVVRTAIEVAAYFGFSWGPLPVDLMIFNEGGLDAFTRGVSVAEWPERAWSLGCICQDVLKTDGWDGHLVLRSSDWVADLSTRQFSRPAKGIAVNPWVLNTAGVEPPWVVREGEVTIHVAPRPEITIYRAAGDWRRNYEGLAASIIRAVKMKV